MKQIPQKIIKIIENKIITIEIHNPIIKLILLIFDEIKLLFENFKF
jgi:hypothetical protein